MASIFHGVKPCRFQWKRWSIGGWYGPEGTILEEPTAWQVLQALLPLLQAPTAMLRGALGEKVISSDQEYVLIHASRMVLVACSLLSGDRFVD